MRARTDRCATVVAVCLLSAALAAWPRQAQADGPPLSCESLPVDALVEDLGRALGLDAASMTHDALWAEVAGRFALGSVDCRLGVLLDAIEQALIARGHLQISAGRKVLRE
jgi:hypothetical protein